MAMIKKSQINRSSSVEKIDERFINSLDQSNNGTLRNSFIENDVCINEEPIIFIVDSKDRESCYSPPPITTLFSDTKALDMDMCPVDTKLDSNTFDKGALACKSQVKTEGIIGRDTNFSPPDFMLDGKQLPPPCKQRKTENVINADPLFPPESCDGMLPSMVNRGSSIDVPFMQSQNKIYVFSTKLANDGAESVKSGACKSIIEYHCAQPETKKFFQRHQLNMNQFNNQNTPLWINNMNNLAMKQKPMTGANSRCGTVKSQFRNSPMMNNDIMNHGCGGPLPNNMNMPSRMPGWNQQSNMNPVINNNNNNNSNNNNNNKNNSNSSNNNSNNNNNNNNQQSQMCNNDTTGSCGPTAGTDQGPMMSGSVGSITHGIGPPMKCPDMISDSHNPSSLMSNSVLPSPHPPLANFNDDQFPSSPRPPLTGIKVPSENLTPAQKTQRAHKLATLKRLEQMLMSENQTDLQQTQQNLVDDISSVLIGDNNNSGQSVTLADGVDGSTIQKMENTNANNANNGNGPIIPTDWQTMPSFFDERSKRLADVNNINRCNNTRSQAPPPPYHQSSQSANIPIAAHSPNPHSPANALSSPHTCSGLSSPAPKPAAGLSPNVNQMTTSSESPGQPHNRNINISNPATPISSTLHLSPNSKMQKDTKMCSGPLSNEFSPASSGQQSPGPVDAVYSRSLQTLAARQQQQKQPSLPLAQIMQSANSHCKEPPLMPVPSPQTIHYHSTFEGQELIIQKQPNTSLKDSSSMVSPSLSQGGLDSMISTSADTSCSKMNVSAPNTPLMPSAIDLPSTKYPNTPGDFSALSPGPDIKPQMRINNVNQMKNDMRFACGSPQLSDQQRFQVANNSFLSQPNKNTFLDTSSPEKTVCTMASDTKDANLGVTTGGPNFARNIMPNNVPMDPTGSRVDPISSLTQMSQQLSNVPSSSGNLVGMIPMNVMSFNMNSGSGPGVSPMSSAGPNSGPGSVPGPGHMPSNNMNMKSGLQMAGPYPPMMGNNPQNACVMRPPGTMAGSYNNMNVQVKPNAPNTIQYLPNRPQNAGGGIRGPPSLEFLRFQNPNAMAGPPTDKMQHNMNYFQGSYPSGPPQGANMNEMMGNMNCPIPQGPSNVAIRGAAPTPGLRGANGTPASPNMMRMGSSNMGLPPYNDQMYSGPGPNTNMQPNSNCHVFMPNNPGGPPGAGGPGPGMLKMPPMTMGGNVPPDATQPLPPSMGQPNNFKGSSYMGQTSEMNDPQYRQQFHNFQQQLYATNTRSQMNSHSMVPSNQQYFMSK